MVGNRDEVHSALTDLYGAGGDLAVAPPELAVYFDDLAIARAARAYMQRDAHVTAGGHAVVVTAGPPGAGKSSTLDSMDLSGYRRIDPDEAKKLLLDDAERHGVLSYRERLILPDGDPVSPLELSAQIHPFSTAVTDIVRHLALSAGENVVIEGTLSWEPLTGQYIDELFASNYEGLDVVDVEAPLDFVVERARQRWWKGRRGGGLGGRFVSDEVVKGFYKQSPDESVCATNARILAERAADELGRGTLRRFDVDPVTGAVKQASTTDFG